MCFVWISEKKTVNFVLYIINRLIFMTDVESLLRGTDWVLITQKQFALKC